MGIQLILIAFIGVWSYYIFPAVTSDATNRKYEIQTNFHNLFNSILKKDIKKAGMYRDILEQAAVRGRQAFDTMKKRVQIGQWRNAHKENHLYSKNRKIDGKAVKLKRSTHEHDAGAASIMEESHYEHSAEIRAGWRTISPDDFANQELEHPTIIDLSFFRKKTFKSRSNSSRQSQYSGKSSAEIGAGWPTISPDDFANQQLEHPTMIDPSFFRKKNVESKSDHSSQIQHSGKSSAEIRAGWRTISPDDFANQQLEHPTIIDPSFFRNKTVESKSDCSHQIQHSGKSSAEIRAGWRTISPDNFANQELEHPTIIDLSFFRNKTFKSKSTSSHQSQHDGENSAEIRAGWRTANPFDYDDEDLIPHAQKMDPVSFQNKYFKPYYDRHQPYHNNETDPPYYANGSKVVINYNYYRTRDAVTSTVTERIAVPYYANGSEVVVNYAYFKTRDSAPNATRAIEELLTMEATRARNPNEMYSPHLHDKYFPERKYRKVTEPPYYANGTGIVINYEYFRTKDDVPPRLDISENDRKKRGLDALNDTSDDISWSFHHPLSEEAMEKILETSTLSASEEKLYRYYETKTWPSTLINTSATKSYSSEDYEDESESEPERQTGKQKMDLETVHGSVTLSEPTSSQFGDSEEKKTPAKVTKKDKLNCSKTDPPPKLRGRTKSTSNRKTRRKSVSRVNVTSAIPSVSQPSESDERGQRTSEATTYTRRRMTYTYTMPTPPPSLSESQENWYAAFDKKFETTLSMDQFRPGDPTWWRSWPSTHWSNFTWTTYPPYHPFNATTTPKDAFKPIYHFRSFEEWKNYTIERERSLNATVNTSDSESYEEYDNEYYMDQSDGHERSQPGKKTPARRMSLPNIYLTPTEHTTKKHKERPLRGLGKLPKSKKRPKFHSRRKNNDDLYDEFVKGKKRTETEEDY